MLLIERTPTLSIFARSHCGLGPTFTLSILRSEKNGHSRVAVMLTPSDLYGVCVAWRRNALRVSCPSAPQFHGQDRNGSANRRGLALSRHPESYPPGKDRRSARQLSHRATKSTGRTHLRRDRARSGCRAFLPTRRRAVCSFESRCRSAASHLEARAGTLSPTL